MWLFQRNDTLDEDEDDCAFVLSGVGGAGVKYLVMRGGGAETGAEAARGGAGRGGGGRMNMSRIVSGRWGAGALAEAGLRFCVSAIEAGQVSGAGGRALRSRGTRAFRASFKS